MILSALFLLVVFCLFLAQRLRPARLGKQIRAALLPRPLRHGAFALALLTLCYALVLPDMALAEEKKPASKQRAVHKMLKDNGWSVCRDMVKNLDLLQLPEVENEYGLVRFHPDMPQFSEPDWEELKIEDNLELIYKIVQQKTPYLLHALSYDGLPFEEWKQRYLQDMRRGYAEDTANGTLYRVQFRPRLRITRVRFEQDGPLLAVLDYDYNREHYRLFREARKCYDPSWTWMRGEPPSDEQRKEYTQCIENIEKKEGGRWDLHRYSNYLYFYDEEKNKRPYGFGAMDPRGFVFGYYPGGQVFLYKQRAYIIRGPAHLSYFIFFSLSIYRVKTYVDEWVGVSANTQEICDIYSTFAEKNNQ